MRTLSLDVALSPPTPDLCLFVARVCLQCCRCGFVTGYRPVKRGSGCLAVLLCPVFVDLVAGIIVGNNRHGLFELAFLQPRVIGRADDSLSGAALFLAEGAAFHRLAVQVGVVLDGEARMPQLIVHFVPPVVLAALPVHELRNALHVVPKQKLAILAQGILGRHLTIWITD